MSTAKLAPVVDQTKKTCFLATQGGQDPEIVGERHKLGYARVSTADQNPDLQIKALERAGVDPRDIFWEQGSGMSTTKRREFQAMMKDVQRGDIVVVWKLDRLGRTAQQLYDTFQRITAKGADIEVITQPGMDTKTPMGRAMFGMLAVFAEFERDMIHERTMAGLKLAREKGRTGGRRQFYSDDTYLDAARLGVAGGAKKLKMTKSGFIKALERARLRLHASTEKDSADAA